jgi:hypothetical protein
MSRGMIKNHICKNTDCQNISMKDRYGNYMNYCSKKCAEAGRRNNIKQTYTGKDMDSILSRRKETLLEKYGVDNAAKIPEVRERLRETTTATAEQRLQATKTNNLAKYGVESTNSLPEVKEKKKQSFIEKYGVDHQLRIPEVAASVAKKNSDNAAERLSKAADTKDEKYGDSNYNNRNKYKETCLERFGVENPTQNPSIHEKQFKHSVYDYIFPLGKSSKSPRI